MNMGIAVIILGLFIILLVVVIYNLGRRLKARDNQINAIKAEIEKVRNATTNGLVFLTLDDLLTFINKQE
jgi:LEA14-like dessication related protein